MWAYRFPVGCPALELVWVCPQSGDAAARLSALVYGVPAPWQVTVDPSPECQVTETGVAVAVTLSPAPSPSSTPAPTPPD